MNTKVNFTYFLVVNHLIHTHVIQFMSFTKLDSIFYRLSL